jgi:hypothetical protein
MFCRLKRGAEPMRGYGRVILLSELQREWTCSSDSGEGVALPNWHALLICG